MLFILESTDPSATTATEQVPGAHSFNKHGLLPAGAKAPSKPHEGPGSRQGDNHTSEISPAVGSAAGTGGCDGLGRDLLRAHLGLSLWEMGKKEEGRHSP